MQLSTPDAVASNTACVVDHVGAQVWRPEMTGTLHLFEKQTVKEGRWPTRRSKTYAGDSSGSYQDWNCSRAQEEREKAWRFWLFKAEQTRAHLGSS